MVKLGVLEYVPGSSKWVSPMTFVPKPDGKMRLVGDFVQLYRYVKRPLHPFKSAKDIINGIGPRAKWFAVIDCVAGYWQLELDEDSSWLTCFLTQCKEDSNLEYSLATLALQKIMLWAMKKS